MRHIAWLAGALILIGSALPAAAGGPHKQTPKQLAATVKKAIAAEKAALKAFDKNKPQAKKDLEASLAELKGAAASSALDPSFSSATSELKQAIAKDEIAIADLHKRPEFGRARAKINAAIVAKERAEATYTAAAALPPTVSPITAQFDSYDRLTVYTITASDPQGENLLRVWKLVKPNPDPDPDCVDFVAKDSSPNEATWYHGDQPDDGNCDHNVEGPRGHIGTVTVAVSNWFWTCTAVYEGTASTAAFRDPNSGAFKPDMGGAATCTRGGSPGH